MGKNFDMIYEEPYRMFDEPSWLAFRDQMQSEVALHPDWREPKESLQMAEEHLLWLKDNMPDIRKAA